MGWCGAGVSDRFPKSADALVTGLGLGGSENFGPRGDSISDVVEGDKKSLALGPVAFLSFLRKKKTPEADPHTTRLLLRGKMFFDPVAVARPFIGICCRGQRP